MTRKRSASGPIVPSQLSSAAEFAGMEKRHRETVAGFEKMGLEPAGDHEARLDASQCRRGLR
jgi:hypothetical protein